MNDLIRPSLYDAYHKIQAVQQKESTIKADIVGPICESGDYFAKDRQITTVQRGDCVAIMSAGAYGFTMASHYNTRPKAVEVLVTGDTYRIIRRRETYEDLVGAEL